MVHLLESVALAFAAVGAGLVLAGTRWGDAGPIALAAVAALLGGYSRLAIASVRFCVYLVLCVGVLLTRAILSPAHSIAATVVVIAALATAMPVLRAKSHLLYSAAMTPPILLANVAMDLALARAARLALAQPRHQFDEIARLVPAV